MGRGARELGVIGAARVLHGGCIWSAGIVILRLECDSGERPPPRRWVINGTTIHGWMDIEVNSHEHKDRDQSDNSGQGLVVERQIPHPGCWRDLAVLGREVQDDTDEADLEMQM